MPTEREKTQPTQFHRPLSRQVPHPLLTLGFRPFFLAAAMVACLAMPAWLVMLHGLLPMPPQLPGSSWHAHEMLFGYALAVIAGFLLTAVRNWTGQATASGRSLLGLVLLWALARLLPWITPLDDPWVVINALVAAAFPLALALSLRPALWTSPNPVDPVFLLLLAGMASAAGAAHLQAVGSLPAGLPDANAAMLGLILLTLLLVSGRVLPFFTRVALAGASPHGADWLERATFGLAILWLVAYAQGQWPAITGAASIGLALLLSLRIAGWYDRRVWRLPILAILYVGYGWLILGLLLTGLGQFGRLPPNLGLHALTVGGIGVFTLGMMVRVILGHTGRVMQAAPTMIAAFLALNLAALLRVLIPLLWPAQYLTWVVLSGLLWSAAFAAFLLVHGPMLWRPRADGKPT
ncbi:MAG: NnrS family protein [Chromatiaceae bacterium]|nr:MAG: NnrS family protein [Chromatiaceae bacterium]